MRLFKHRQAVWLVILLAVTGMAQTARDQRLAGAAERQDVQALRTLLKQGADVNGKQADGATALHWAAHWDKLDAVDLLLSARANVNATNDYGVTPLALACENGSAAMVEKLLAGGANANVAVSTGETALMTAARSGSVDAVKALGAHGADINAKEPTHGQTALMWAVANQHPEVVRVLVEMGADVHARSDVRPRVVHTGNRFGDRGNDKGVVTMDLGGFTPLLFAARDGDLEAAKILLGAGADANEQAANGSSVLLVAAHSGNGPLARYLLDVGAEPNAEGAGYTPLHAAVLRGDVDLVTALLAKGANPNAKIVKGTSSRYYSKDWAINETALVGATPYWQAARYGDVPIMKLLAAAGADTTFAMADGTTALIAAVAGNNGFGTGDRRERYLGPGDIAPTAEEKERLTVEVARTAIELGAKISAATQTGDTALHTAASQALDSVVQLLVDKGADLEATNKRGLTPLGVALVPRPPSPIQIEGVDRRKSTAELLRKLGAKEPDPATLKAPALDPRMQRPPDFAKPPQEPRPTDSPEKRQPTPQRQPK
jgi:ankyrin repeat protein